MHADGVLPSLLAGLQALTAMTALQELHVSYCGGLTDAGVLGSVAPLTCHSLAHIHVMGCSGLTQAICEGLTACRVSGVSSLRGASTWPPVLRRASRAAAGGRYM